MKKTYLHPIPVLEFFKRPSEKEIGREVCGTCLYGLNIGFDGN